MKKPMLSDSPRAPARTSPGARGARDLAALLAAATLATTAACAGRNVVVPPATSAPSGGTATARDGSGAPAPDLAELQGRVIAVSISDLGAGNVVRAIDPRTGGTTDLWSISEITTLGDWRPLADGSRVLYRLSSANNSAWDRLFVQDLRPDARPTEIAGERKMWQSHFAGAQWSPDGGSVAYGRQVGTPAQSSRFVDLPHEWQLLSSAVAEHGAPETDQGASGGAAASSVLWRSGDDPRSLPLTLVAWRPSAGRAALLELAPDGGHASAVRVIDTSTGRVVARHELDSVPGDAASSRDGRWLALADSMPASLELVRLGDGRRFSIGAAGPGWQPGSPVWSDDGRWVAWTELAGSSAGGNTGVARVRAMRVDTEAGPLDGGPRFEVSVPGTASEAAAFSPDGSLLLVAEADPYTVEPSRLYAYRLADGAGAPLPWAPPAGTWRLDWVGGPSAIAP